MPRMHRLPLALCLTLMAVPALAQDAKAMGFTQDGVFFVIGRYDSIGGDTINTYFVWDTRSSSQIGMGYTPEEYKEWLEGEQLAPLKTGLVSPDGKMKLQVSGSGRWKLNKKGMLEVPGECTWTGGSGPEVKLPPPARITFSVQAGGKRWTSLEKTFSPGNVGDVVEFIWSPDGKRVAYLIHGDDMCNGGWVAHSVTFGPTQGPRVQVLTAKGAPYKTPLETWEALEGAGFVTVGDGEAKGEHPTTVIFAAKGFEAQAKKAAAVLPGAKVDKLTWKPGYDLVVVLKAP